MAQQHRWGCSDAGRGSLLRKIQGAAALSRPLPPRTSYLGSRWHLHLQGRTTYSTRCSSALSSAPRARALRASRARHARSVQAARGRAAPPARVPSLACALLALPPSRALLGDHPRNAPCLNSRRLKPPRVSSVDTGERLGVEMWVSTHSATHKQLNSPVFVSKYLVKSIH